MTEIDNLQLLLAQKKELEEKISTILKGRVEYGFARYERIRAAEIYPYYESKRHAGDDTPAFRISIKPRNSKSFAFIKTTDIDELLEDLQELAKNCQDLHTDLVRRFKGETK